MGRSTPWIGLTTVVAMILLAAPARGAERERREREDEGRSAVVPRKITDYINVRFPGAQITRVERGKADGKPAYAIRLQHGGSETRAIFRASGAMIQFERTLDAAPQPVAQGVEARYPKARIKDVVQVSVVRGKQEKPHHYSATISLADGRMTRVAVSPDGRRVGEERQEPFRVGGGGEAEDESGEAGDDDGGGGMHEREDEGGEDDEREGRDDD